MVRYLPQTVIQMDPHKSGTWVLYEDYAKERDTKDRRIDTLERQLAEAQEKCRLMCGYANGAYTVLLSRGVDAKPPESVFEGYTSAPKDSMEKIMQDADECRLMCGDKPGNHHEDCPNNPNNGS